MNNLFTLEGRITRTAYITSALGISVATTVLGVVFNLFMTTATQSTGLVALVAILVTVLAVLMLACQIVRRLHDIDRSGWHYWLFLVPGYNLYLSILLLLKKGTPGPNQFGSDPASA